MKHKIRFNKPLNEFKHLLIIGLGFVAYGLLVIVSGNTSICVFKVHTGIPCPGCGMTRAMLALMQADLHAAFFWHPLWPMVFLLPSAYFIAHKSGEKGKRYKAYFLKGTLYLVLGVYVFRMFLMFPNTAPLDFNNDAIPLKFIRYLGRF